MRRSILLPVTLVIIALTAPDRAVADEQPEIEVGRPFPDLILPSLDDGLPMSIRSYRGKKVLLHVFASW